VWNLKSSSRRYYHCVVTERNSRIYPPQLWPPNSPDLNPVDHSVWGLLQQKLYKIHIIYLDELKQRLKTEWNKRDHVVSAVAVRQRWQKHRHVRTTCPETLRTIGTAASQNFDRSIASTTPWPTTPLRHITVQQKIKRCPIGITSLPSKLQCDNLGQFKRLLKTHLFGDHDALWHF